jgi:hypothetical protein
MLTQEITLSQYLRLGGNIDKIDWSKAACTYGDYNNDVRIVSCKDTGETNPYG